MLKLLALNMKRFLALIFPLFSIKAPSPKQESQPSWCFA